MSIIFTVVLQFMNTEECPDGPGASVCIKASPNYKFLFMLTVAPTCVTASEVNPQASVKALKSANNDDLDVNKQK